MLNRSESLAAVKALYRTHRIVVLLGSRQCGKTTLAKTLATTLSDNDEPAVVFDLESPESLAQLKNPVATLAPIKGLIIIDEAQRMPELFPVLRYIHDEYPEKRFLLLGSATRDLIQSSSETLAGRIAYIELTPFHLGEVDDVDALWLRGGYPRSYLAETDADSFDWRRHYIRSYLEQDLNMMGIKINPESLRRFWNVLTHYHGQIFNANEIAQNLGISQPTAMHYLNVLHQTFMIRVLQPWYANIKKRQVKSPKIYWRDSGLFHSFINTPTHNDLVMHPKIGASFEGFALEQTIQKLRVDTHDCYFWGAHSFGEVDLVIHQNNKLRGFEFKLNDAPKLDKRWPKMVDELGLTQLTVVYPGKAYYPLTDTIDVMGIRSPQFKDL